MSVIRNLEPIRSKDFTLKRVKSEKNHVIPYEKIIDESSGFSLLHIEHSRRLPEPSNQNFGSGNKNIEYNVKKRALWHQIDHLYFRDLVDDNYTNYFSDYDNRFLNYSGSVISIPMLRYGDTIKPGSVEINVRSQLNGTDLQYIDDGNGNLIDNSELSSVYNNLDYNFKSGNLIGYWSFDELFRNNRFITGSISKVNYKWISKRLSTGEFNCAINNVNVENGAHNNGLSLTFPKSDSYVLIDHNKNFNFNIDSEFSIHFWIKPVEDTRVTPFNIITKRGVIRKDLKGHYNVKSTINAELQTRFKIETDYINEFTDVYPYNIRLTSNNTIHFSRSDGTNIAELESTKLQFSPSPESTPLWNHVSIIRYKDGDNFKIKMILNGHDTLNRFEEEVIDNTLHTNNNHCLIFGNSSREEYRSNLFLTMPNLDEIRFYKSVVRNQNGELTVNEFYNKLSHPSMTHITNIVGNVFYKSGMIVLSPREHKHINTFQEEFNGIDLKFKSKHYIYNYETLCRIPKGSFNLTMNPTALIHPESDTLIDQFKSEFGSGSLRPYATSIGLYNPDGELIAVAKFGQPIQMRDDVDINVLVKWDA